MLKTRITEMLGIRHPIIQGGMIWTSKAELVAAVSNAGGLGILTSASFPTKEEFRQEVNKTKSLTNEPFGVNLGFLPRARELPTEGYIEVIIAERVKAVETVGAIQESVIERLHKSDILCIHKAVTVRHALRAEKMGVDAVSVEGFECAGHPGMDNVSSPILIQRAVQQLKVPIIAGGGFVDGKGLVSALALGAEAVFMGTRFLVTKECPVHPNIKEWCVKAKETDTILALRSIGDPVRYMRTELAESVLAMEERGAELEELLPVISGERFKQVLETGNLNAGVCSCSQGVGLINDIPSVKDLVDRIMSEAADVIKRLNSIQYV